MFRNGIRITPFVILVMLISIPLCNISTSKLYSSPSIDYQMIKEGPSIDSVKFKITDNSSQLTLDLQSGAIDMHTGFLSETQVNSLKSTVPFIERNNVTGFGYGQITINCRDAPLNESILRRAFAFAFDKTTVIIDIMNGSSPEHDSLVPTSNGWCIEDELTNHYYTNQSLIGNQLLNDSGLFPFDGADEYRTYRGDPFNITIEYAAASPEIAGGMAQIGVDALRRLGINAQTQAVDFSELISRLDSHGEYDMAFYGLNIPSNTIDWLAYSYWSDYADVEYQNPTNFRNITYDSWRNQLLNGITYEEVYEAASEMQKILQYNVPRLVCYERTNYQAYRTDTFEGYINDISEGISNSWSLRQMHPVGSSQGGNVSVGIIDAPTSFNIFNYESSSSQMILDLLYPSLYDNDPTHKSIGNLATALTVQKNSDNSDVPLGHTRYIIDILENATWSDGTPLTALDVNFTLQFVSSFSNALPGSFWYEGGIPPDSLIYTHVSSPYQIVIEFDTESYWDFSYFAFGYIVPEHIFTNDTFRWDYWNPVFNSSDSHVTCGPFIMSDYVIDDYYSLTQNPDFYYAQNRMTIPTEPSSITNTTTGTSTPELFNPLTYVLIIISAISLTIIIAAVLRIYRYRKINNEENLSKEPSTND